MTEQNAEYYIAEILVGDAQKNALDFLAYLRANEMLFERGKGYWAGKLYWLIKYKDEYVCFILVNGGEDETEPEGWVIWSDDSDSDWYANSHLDEHTKAIAWENIDFCANCGSCSGGMRKTIFGREFDNVCRTTFRFNNPNVEALECLKELVEIRKNHCDGRF
ncbi:MAG: hypothetical protein PHV32_03815 [Eubacteriales bacterium]|nr:hypothetical protein [Eubacteriales bacterium]